MGFGVAICIVIIDIFKCRSPLHGSVYPWKREDVTHLKQRQLGVDFFSMTIWELCSGWRRDNPSAGLCCQGSKQPPGREQREHWSHTHCLQRWCFKLLVTRKMMGQTVCWCSSSQLQQSYSRRDVSCSQSVPSFACSNSMRMAKKCIRVLQTWFEFSSVCLVYFKSLGYDGIMVVGSCELGFFLQLHIEKKNQKKTSACFPDQKENKKYSLIHIVKNRGFIWKIKASWDHWAVVWRRSCYVQGLLCAGIAVEVHSH